MTYEEIYNEIVEQCFPGVGGNPPENMPAVIMRKVRSCQRMINRDFPFWFTLVTDTLNTVEDQSVYALTGLTYLFKEIERVWFTVDGQTYGTAPLTQLDITDSLDRGFQMDSTTVEYPTSFMIDGSNLVLYPTPSEVRVLNLLYWRFLPSVPIDTFAEFIAYEDDIGEYCGEAIVAWVTSKIKLMQGEAQESELYLRDFNTFIEGAMQEDKYRRSIPQNVAPYRGGSGSGYVLS